MTILNIQYKIPVLSSEADEQYEDLQPKEKLAVLRFYALAITPLNLKKLIGGGYVFLTDSAQQKYKGTLNGRFQLEHKLTIKFYVTKVTGTVIVTHIRQDTVPIEVSQTLEQERITQHP